MKQTDLKKGIVYLYKGSGDGCNILFSPKEDASYKYHSKGCIVLHWSGNELNLNTDGGIGKYHLPTVRVASSKATKYYNDCVEAGEDVGGFSWQDSNDR